MANFLLIHGSCHGAWCWRDVIPALVNLGHSATAIDLPSHGADSTPIKDVTLDLYARAILGEINRPTIVVGHSAGGYAIAKAADIDPRNITQLVYLCAYVPSQNRTMIEMRHAAPYQNLGPDDVIRSPDRLSYHFNPARIGTLLYPDCPTEAIEYAQENLGEQPIAPQETRPNLGPHFAQVPRHYIRCANDGVIPPEFQTTMTADWPATDVETMATGHSPFFAAPDDLANHLSRIAQK